MLGSISGKQVREPVVLTGKHGPGSAKKVASHLSIPGPPAIAQDEQYNFESAALHFPYTLLLSEPLRKEKVLRRKQLTLRAQVIIP